MRINCLIFMLAMLSCNSQKNTINGATHLGLEQLDYAQTEQFQLSTPVVQLDSILFIESTKLEISFDLDGVEKFVSINDGRYETVKQAIEIESSATIRAFIKHPDYLNSDTLVFQVHQTSNNMAGVDLSMNPEPSLNYPGGGPSSLIDLKKGSLNFRQGNDWSGFQTKVLNLNLDLKAAQHLEQVAVSLLSDHGSWIFRPKTIQVYSDLELVGSLELDVEDETSRSSLEIISVPIEERTFKNLRIEIHSLDEIPDWHAGAGTMPWLFIDEILLN